MLMEHIIDNQILLFYQLLQLHLEVLGSKNLVDIIISYMKVIILKLLFSISLMDSGLRSLVVDLIFLRQALDK